MFIYKRKGYGTHTLPKVNAKVSIDVCISPNIVPLFSLLTSLTFTPVGSEKPHEKWSQKAPK